MIKIGDKVKRIKGYHGINGMKVGDIGTVINICNSTDNILHVQLQEYPAGWHNVDNLQILHKDKTKQPKVNSKIRLNKLEHEKKKIEEEIKKIKNNEIEIIDAKVAQQIVDRINQSKVDISFAKRNREVFCYVRDISSKKVISRGKAIAMEGDKYSFDKGVQIALHRAMISYHRKKMYELISN